MNNWVDSKTLTMGTGVLSGVGLTAYTTGMLSTAAYGLSAPVIAGGILGLLSTQYLAVPLHMKYRSILRNSPDLQAFCHFTIRATTAMLGTWIGLAATSFLFHLTINPFILPALITAGISASIILGLYLYAYSHERAMRNQGNSSRVNHHRSSNAEAEFGLEGDEHNNSGVGRGAAVTSEDEVDDLGMPPTSVQPQKLGNGDYPSNSGIVHKPKTSQNPKQYAALRSSSMGVSTSSGAGSFGMFSNQSTPPSVPGTTKQPNRGQTDVELAIAKTQRMRFVGHNSVSTGTSPSTIAIYFRADDADLDRLRTKFRPTINATEDTGVYVTHVLGADAEDSRSALQTVPGVTLLDDAKAYQNAMAFV